MFIAYVHIGYLLENDYLPIASHKALPICGLDEPAKSVIYAVTNVFVVCSMFIPAKDIALFDLAPPSQILTL